MVKFLLLCEQWPPNRDNKKELKKLSQLELGIALPVLVRCIIEGVIM